MYQAVMLFGTLVGLTALIHGLGVLLGVQFDLYVEPKIESNVSQEDDHPKGKRTKKLKRALARLQ